MPSYLDDFVPPKDPAALARLKNELSLDILQFGLDLVGIVDPTPVSDGVNTLVSFARGDWLGGGLSALGMVPYLGDMAKAGKLGKYVQSLAKAVKLAELDPGFAKLIRPALERLYRVMDDLPDAVVPEALRSQFQEVYARLGQLLRRAPAARRVANFAGFVGMPAFRNRSVGDVLRWLRTNGFQMVKETKLTPAGKTDNIGGSMIWVRYKPNPTGKGPQLVEAVRIDPRGHPNPRGFKDVPIPHNRVTVQGAYGEVRHMHKELIEAPQLQQYIQSGLKNSKGQYVAPPAFDDAGKLIDPSSPSYNLDAHIWLTP